MQLYKELNILEDKKLYNKINLFSLVILLVTTVSVLLAHLIVNGELHLSFSFSNYLWIVGIFFVSLPVHELFMEYSLKLFQKQEKLSMAFQKRCYMRPTLERSIRNGSISSSFWLHLF